MSETIQKTCSKCGKGYPATAEYFVRRGSGLRGVCRPCENERTRNQRIIHPEKERARSMRYRENNPERVREQSRRYRESHREQCRTSARNSARKAWATNPNKMRTIKRQWLKLNRIRVRRYAHNRRSQMAKSGGSYALAEIGKLYDLQKAKCWWCGTKFKDSKYEIDHRVPLSRGGSNDISNIVLAHAKCNRSKGAKMPYEFAGRLL